MLAKKVDERVASRCAAISFLCAANGGIMNVLGVVVMALMSFTAEAIPNPAAVFCEEHGGVLDTRRDSGGDQYGVCMFEEGGVTSECNQWEFFDGHCQPGQCKYWSAELRDCEISARLNR